MNKILTLDQLQEAFVRSDVEQKKEKECRGLIFRYCVEGWVGTQLDVNFQQRMRFIKSLSCTGCDCCQWMIDDDLHEEVSNDAGVCLFYNNKFKEGELYQFKVVASYTDWETGHPDGVEFGFVKVESK